MTHTNVALCPHPQILLGAPRRARRSLCGSPSAAAASPTSRSPVPPSAAPRNRAEREALPERYYPVLSVIT